MGWAASQAVASPVTPQCWPSHRVVNVTFRIAKNIFKRLDFFHWRGETKGKILSDGYKLMNKMDMVDASLVISGMGKLVLQRIQRN